MAQYIEREKFIKKCTKVFGHFGVLVKAIEEVLDECTTADFVPKSDVEELIAENESLAKTVNEASELIRKLRSKVKKSKSDVAKDIFEEIEGIISPMLGLEDDKEYVAILTTAFDELKKKYSEGE